MTNPLHLPHTLKTHHTTHTRKGLMENLLGIKRGPGPAPRCDLLPQASPLMHASDYEPATAVESQEWSPCYRGVGHTWGQ